MSELVEQVETKIEETKIEEENLDQTQNVEMEVKKKVEFNDVVDEKIIENIVNLEREDDELHKTKVSKVILDNFLKLIDIPVSRGVFKANEVSNVGKAYMELKEEITEAEESSILKKNINNIRILVEIALSRGGYTSEELSDVGDLYNFMTALLK